MKDLIIKTEKVNWRELIPYQPDDLKKTTPELMQKLKTSLLNNGLASPLNIWEKNGKRFCLDAHHRIKVLHELESEGKKMPDKLTANFLNVQNDKQAKKLILVFNSHYATIEKKGLRGFLEGMDFKELKLEFEPFKLNYGLYLDEEIEEDDPPAIPKKAISKTGDLYELGPHRV